MNAAFDAALRPVAAPLDRSGTADDARAANAAVLARKYHATLPRGGHERRRRPPTARNPAGPPSGGDRRRRRGPPTAARPAGGPARGRRPTPTTPPS